jgi:hypothetical protein
LTASLAKLEASFFSLAKVAPTSWGIKGIVNKVGAVLRRTSKSLQSRFRAKDGMRFGRLCSPWHTFAHILPAM